MNNTVKEATKNLNDKIEALTTENSQLKVNENSLTRRKKNTFQQFNSSNNNKSKKNDHEINLLNAVISENKIQLKKENVIMVGLNESYKEAKKNDDSMKVKKLFNQLKLK